MRWRISHANEKNAGFTLVELLVVIGIIAILIGILLPTLAAARRRVNDVKCLSNLKAVSMAFRMYANDNHDYFPPRQGLSYPANAGPSPIPDCYAAGNFPDGTSMGGVPTSINWNWFGGWANGITPMPFVPEAGYLYKYWGSANVGGCPNVTSDTFGDPTGANWRTYYGPVCYAYNSYCDKGAPTTGAEHVTLRMANFKSPSTKALCWDSARYNASAYQRTPWGYPTSGYGMGTSPNWKADPNFNARHTGNTGNVVWMDGHASAFNVYYVDDYSVLNNTTSGLATMDKQYKIGNIYDGPYPLPSPTPADIDKYYDPLF